MGKMHLPVGANGQRVTVSTPKKEFPRDFAGHRVYLEQDLEEGVFFFHCAECSRGTGLSEGEIGEEHEEMLGKLKKYGLAFFIDTDCDDNATAGSELNVNVQQNGSTGAIANVSGDVDAATRQSVLRTVQNRLMGKLNTPENRKL